MILRFINGIFVISFVSKQSCCVQISQEVLDNGRQQYRLLQERGSLPKFGDCWRLATEHVEYGCHHLTEHTQSSIALKLTNCFLDMSGHETYSNCESDYKWNVRAICIASMSDRAFHVYTEFYTHAQNMCIFLRGLAWQEAIVESTHKVGAQLETTARNQEDLLKGQQESLQLQEQLLHYGQSLQKIMAEFYLSTQQHQELLTTMSSNLGSLQSWLVGEVSWIDSAVFYATFTLIFTLLTSTNRTSSARFPILLIFTANAMLERLLYLSQSFGTNVDFASAQKGFADVVWWCRKGTLGLTLFLLGYKSYMYTDFEAENNVLLKKIHEQNLSMVEVLKEGRDRNQVMMVKELISGSSEVQEVSERVRKSVTPKRWVSHINDRYNLRSRQGTPAVTII